MKVTNTTSNSPKSFQPVTLSVTFESEDELKELWSRLNSSWASFVEHMGKYCFDNADLVEGDIYPLWDHVNNILTHASLDDEDDE